MHHYSCDDCKKKLDGLPMVTVNLQRETFEEATYLRIHASENLFVYCIECARRRDFDRLAIPLANDPNGTALPGENDYDTPSNPILVYWNPDA